MYGVLTKHPYKRDIFIDIRPNKNLFSYLKVFCSWVLGDELKIHNNVIRPKEFFICSFMHWNELLIRPNDFLVVRTILLFVRTIYYRMNKSFICSQDSFICSNDLLNCPNESFFVRSINLFV